MVLVTMNMFTTLDLMLLKDSTPMDSSGQEIQLLGMLMVKLFTLPTTTFQILQ
eukprot:jgi/Orpsp1_1/1189960/evm.model.d7180000075789.1